MIMENKKTKFLKKQPTMMSKKYYSMLLGGTLTMMVVSAMLMSDSIIAGAVVGPNAVAGVTLVTPLYSVAAFFGSLISLGVPIIYTTEMGKFHKKEADQVFGLGVLLSVVTGIVLFVLISLFGNIYLSNYTSSDAILLQAREYLFWIRCTILILPIQTLLAAVVYSDGDETVSTVASGVQGVGNIAFSIILSHSMGVRGIGLASFIFNVVSLALLMIHFAKKTNSLKWNLYFSLPLLKEVVRFGIIDSSSYLFLAIMTSALNAFISAQFGSEYLILASAISLSREFQLVFDGIGQAAGPIFSVYVGEESRSGLRSSYDMANRSAIIEGIAVTVLLIVIAPFVPQFLNVTDPGLFGWVVACIRITALGSVFISLLYLLTSYYLVIEKIALGVLACALRDVVLSTGLALLLGKIIGLYGMFIGLAVSPAIAYGLLLLFLRLRYGKEDGPLILSEVKGTDDSYLFPLLVDVEQVMEVQREVEDLLREHDVNEKTVVRAMLLIEEMYTVISQMNKDKPVLAECTVILRPDGVQIISKDDGVSFDLADEDISTISLSAYTMASFLEQRDFGNRHLTTMSFNRSSFFIKYNE